MADTTAAAAGAEAGKEGEPAGGKDQHINIKVKA